MDCRIQPSFDRVVLKEDSAKELTEGGIIIPAVAQDKSKTSTVVAVGAGTTFYRPGDRVIHTKYTGIEIEVDKVMYIIAPETEIIGKLLTPPSN